jgi:cysteine-S-conjugate beta-lyase
MWVADMDFVSCPAIVQALCERAEHGVFGYATTPPELIPAFVEHCQRLYGWAPDPEWVLLVPGLVPALHLVCLALAEPGEQIMVCTPVYPPFLSAPETTGRRALAVPLGRDAGAYVLDWAAMEAAVTPRTRMVLFCSPHNPVGRAFTLAELTQLVGFCNRHHLLLCSDEIHCDLLLDGSRHTPLLCVPGADAGRTLVMMSPAKTFNIAGTNLGMVVAPDRAVRQRLLAAAQGLLPHPNTFGYAAAVAALRHGGPWRQELVRVLRRNAARVHQFVDTAMPGFRMTRVEATYLAWIDCRDARLPQPPAAFFEAAGVGLSDGLPFGGPGFVRLNFGCPAALLEQGLARMRQALCA